MLATPLTQIIYSNSVTMDTEMEQGAQPAPIKEIYQSDLGELLTTYYFEEKLSEGERFVIPLKNITFREREESPDGESDAFGYKISDATVEILSKEAKISYRTRLRHKHKVPTVIRRLSDYAERLNLKDVIIIGWVIVSIERNLTDKNSVTYGCTLIRDYTSVYESTCFGKLNTKQTYYEPGKVHFSILSFRNESIKDSVDLFYRNIQELMGK